MIILVQNLKKEIKIKNNNNYLKFYFQLQKNSQKKKRNKVCFNTSRTKSFYKFFNLSRQSIKEFASNELLPGIVKSSW